jgi:hypothetical protein
MKSVSPWGLLALCVLAWTPTMASAQGYVEWTGNQVYGADVFGRMAIADLDGDGSPDAAMPVSVPCGDFPLRWSRNDGSGLFFLEPDLETTSHVALRTGDVDGDGGVDLVLGDGRYYSVASGYPTSGSLGSLDAVDLALVDMDGDGLDDVITSGVAGLQVHVNAGGSLLPAIDIDPNITAASLQLADVDEDGDLDLLATRPNLTWYENDGLLSIPTPALLGGSANAVRMGDLDGDGMGDLVVAAADPGSGGSAISWHRGLGGGLFEAPVSIWSIATPDINAVELADFDGDGDLDIASGQDERGLAFLDNLGGAVFAPVRETGVTTVIGLVVADIDGDGDLDLFARSSWTQDGTCACCAGGGTVEWYENRWCLGDGDGDGICDDLDPCPLDNPDDPDGDGLCGLTAPCLPDGTADSDWDGLPDSCDWCPDDWGNDSDQDGV